MKIQSRISRAATAAQKAADALKVAAADLDAPELIDLFDHASELAARTALLADTLDKNVTILTNPEPLFQS